MDTPENYENYDDVIINRPRSQGVTGEMHRTTFFSNHPSHVYMIIVMGWRKLAEIRI